jgi:hypothetical protein
MISNLKLPFSFDAAALQIDLNNFGSDDWIPHFNRSYYEGDWSGIALRSPANAHVALYPDPTVETFVDTEHLVKCRAVKEILDVFECKTETVRFLRLRPGAAIREHRDYKLSFEDGVARIHIPAKTSQGVEFYLDGHLITMNEGEAWYLNFNLPHSVVNKGDEDRIHLVIDCIVNDWLRQVFDATVNRR